MPCCQFKAPLRSNSLLLGCVAAMVCNVAYGFTPPCFAAVGAWTEAALQLRPLQTASKKPGCSVGLLGPRGLPHNVLRHRLHTSVFMSLTPGEMLECSEENVLRVLEMARMEMPDMFGRSPRAQNIGITGDVSLSSLDGPFVILRLDGRFWHKRTTVMTQVANMLATYIPELAGVDIEDEDMLLDVWEEKDPATGEVVSRVDRRAPDFNGDRETMEYNGVNPDDRGPFGQTLFG